MRIARVRTIPTAVPDVRPANTKRLHRSVFRRSFTNAAHDTGLTGPGPAHGLQRRLTGLQAGAPPLDGPHPHDQMDSNLAHLKELGCGMNSRVDQHQFYDKAMPLVRDEMPAIRATIVTLPTQLCNALTRYLANSAKND